jgi:hypothetical protein
MRALRSKALIAAGVVVTLAIASASLATHAGGSTIAAPATRSEPCGVAKGPPKVWRHVIWIVFENERYSQIIGSSSAPYINKVANQCGLATNFFAETHPSLPNYIAMTSGATQGISDDRGPSNHPLIVPSIFSLLGANWRALQESMPSNCDHSDSGSYVVSHNPATYYPNIRAQCAKQDVPLGPTPDISARFTFITPNACNDMHDCSVGTGDSWLSTLLPKILASRQYRSGSTAVFITWDEDDYNSNQRIAMIVVAPSTPVGTRSTARFDHYALLRTTEEMLGLKPLLDNAARAVSMRAVFHLNARARRH